MTFTTIEVPGTAALAELEGLRANFPMTGEYPFLIGEPGEFERINDAAEGDERSPEEITRSSFDVDLDAWIAASRAQAEEGGFGVERLIGPWPSEPGEQGAICLHKDLVTGRVHPMVCIGLARISEPWQLPAARRARVGAATYRE